MPVTAPSETFNDKQLRSVLDNTVDGIVVINSRGVVLSYNRACELLFGYPANDVIGKNVHMLMPQPHRDNHDGYIGKYLDTNEAKIIGIGREVAGLRKDGTIFPMWLSIGEVVEGGNHFFVGIIRDITEEKEHERQVLKYTTLLERSNHELDDFVYLISHDLKEPVRGIYSYAQFMLEDYGARLDDDGRGRLKSLMKMSVRMNELIDNLLHFSRLDKIQLSYADLDLNVVVHGVLELTEALIQEHKAKIIIENKLPNVLCDQARVGEIFRNLITNAIKYNDKTDKIVRVGVMNESAKYPVLYVQDNGIGIPDKHFESVFKMFKRLHGREAFGGGTGSGLAFVKKIIGQHGGKIWIESVVGEGTTFYFTLHPEG